MNSYSPSENTLRVTQGLLALINGHAIEFSKNDNDLIVVFDGPFDKFSGGRVLLFQQFFLDCTGVMPEITRQVPACIKVFFALGTLDLELKKRISIVLNSDEAASLYAVLDISHLQFRGEIISRKAMTAAPRT